MNKENTCPKCGNPVIKKVGKYGYFYGCSNYPSCKFTASFSEYPNGFSITKWREKEIDRIGDGEYIASLNGG